MTNRHTDPASKARNEFSTFEQVDFVNWLDNGLRGYYSPIKEAPPFSFASFFIGRLDSILDDLGYVYNHLVPPEKQPLFRYSIGSLLRRDVSSRRLPDDAVSDLLYLVAEVHAYEALDSLCTVVEDNVYSTELPWLQFEAISILKQLLPAQEAIDAIKRFVTSPNFNCRFTFDVLISLCLSDPVRWPDHLALMDGSITKLYQEAEEHGGDAPRQVYEEEIAFQNEFARSISTSLIRDGIITHEAELTEIQAYNRCIHLIRQLKARLDSPAYILTEPSNDVGDDRYFITLIIEEDRLRSIRFSVSGRYYFILFKRAIDENCYFTLLSAAHKDAFREHDRRLRVERTFDAPEDSAVEAR